MLNQKLFSKLWPLSDTNLFLPIEDGYSPNQPSTLSQRSKSGAGVSVVVASRRF